MTQIPKNCLVPIIVVAALALAAQAHADEIADWTEATLRAGLIAGASPTTMSRVAVLVQASMFDAVNGIDKRYTHIRVAPTGPTGASRRAAAVQAAYVILSNLFGSRLVAAPALPSAAQLAAQATLDARLRVSFLGISAKEGLKIDAGAAWGEDVANQIWTWRAADGFGPVPLPLPRPHPRLVDGGGPPTCRCRRRCPLQAQAISRFPQQHHGP